MSRFSRIPLFGIIALMLVALLQPLGFASAQSTAGFHISGRNLLDANGNNFIIRGISHAHTWYPSQTSSFAAIKAAGANTIRVVLSGGRWSKNTASDVSNVIQLCKTNKLICVLEDHDTTGYGEDGAAYTLAQAVDYWKELQPVLTGQEAYVIINIGNEPYGNNNPSAWTAATKNAIIALRSAGFKHTIMVDAPSWGQDWANVMRDNAASVFTSDVDRNTIFSVHMYGVYDTAAEIQNYLAAFATANLPLLIGEFGFNHSDGNPDEDTIMSEAQTRGVGYMGWSWSGNGGGVEYLDMVTSFDPTKLTSWGDRIINGANGLKQTSQQASVYSGTTPTTNPTTQPTSVPPTNTPTQPTSTPGACAVTYTPNQWNTGFTAEVKLTNNGASTSNWTLTWSFAGNQQITSAWNATVTQSGSQVTVKPSASWNTTIPTGGSVGFGFQATYSGTNATPTNFALNGVACNGGPQPTTQPTVAPTNTTRPTNTTQPTVAPTNTTRPTNTTQPTVAPTNTTRPTNTTQPTVAPTNTTRPTNTTQPTTQPTSTPGACAVTYTPNQWNTGFTAEVKLTNNGASTSNWALTWSFAGNQQITSAWNATVTQSGSQVTVKPSADWNSTLSTGGSASFGFQASYSGTNATPTNFALNGVACNGGPQPTTTVQPTNQPTVAPTTGPTSQPTVAPTTGPTTQPTVAPTAIPGTHVDNPFFGAQGYINPDYAARVQAAATTTGGTLGARMAKVAQYSTAVWMDRTAAIAGSATARSLEGHLDAALAQQQASGQQVVITVVIYNLPNRDCSALSSNGELLIAQNGLARYQSEYIDPIAALFSKPKYSTLRIATIIEPDSLPNLLTNLSFAKCAEANSTGAYVKGVQYALNKLHAIPNVYTYIDIAHAGWLGWSSNFGPMVNLLKTTVGGTTAGLSSVDGFISNTANTSPVQEPFMTATQQVGGQPVRSAKFFDWNDYIDEASFDSGMYNALVAAGFPSNIGMLIDTSRNGWGGTARPTAASTSTDLNTFVNASKIDRRIHKGNWCNPDGAGIGARPQANPLPHFDAYVWIKPPGESDGSSAFIPNDEGKGFDRMCDPTYTGNSLNGNNLTGALPNAPLSGQWFQAQFEQLVQNAFPAFAP